MSVFSISLSATSVFNLNYDATVNIRSLKERKSVSERVIILRKNILVINALRYGSALVASGTSVRIDISLDPIEVY